MTPKTSLAAAFVFMLAACTSTPATTPATPPVTTTAKPPAMAVAASHKIDISKLAIEKRDPTCGMPVKAGVVDTLTAKGKLYGFCAKECKDEFLLTIK
jgi:YHS domain-containing protein